jgi:hypothetical protein
MVSAWAITGEKIPATAMRSLVYASTGGARGVSSPGDLKVTATAPTSASVRVARGGALIPSGYGGAEHQTYAVFDANSQVVPVAGLGASTVQHRVIVARIDDPDYVNASTQDHARYEAHTIAPGQITNRASALTWAKQIGTSSPVEPLALVVVPANSSVITDAMITDLRALAIPRSERVIKTEHTHGQVFTKSTPAGSDANPQFHRVTLTGNPGLVIPAWATHCQMIVTIHDLRGVGNVYGKIAASFDGNTRSEGDFIDVNDATSNPWRTSFSTAGKWNVTGQRGQTPALGIWYERRNFEGHDTGDLDFNANTNVTFDIWFTEEAV